MIKNTKGTRKLPKALEKYAWKKGFAPNPKGRPKGHKYFSETARQLLVANELHVSWTVNGKTKNLDVVSDQNMHHGLVAALIMEGMKGNVRAIQELIDRTEGKPVQAIEQTVTTAGVSPFDGLTTAELRGIIAEVKHDLEEGDPKGRAKGGSKKKPS
ncbi:MAG TPA: DUF5681 domain-containing protein [Rugosibacter sp.]|nr:DUF5681 domain-containing protein [Rugosibacter sp.]